MPHSCASAKNAARAPARTLFGLVVAALVVVGGCGGDAGPARQEFIAQADGICADLDRRVERYVDPPRGPDGLVRFSA